MNSAKIKQVYYLLCLPAIVPIAQARTMPTKQTFRPPPCVNNKNKASAVYLCGEIERMIPLFRPGPSDPASDEALLAQHRSSGEARYLGQLYERYMPMVYGVCVKILKDTGLAEDAVMAIYETLDRKVQDHTIESFRGWLYVLARNHCLMEWRKKQRRPTDLHAPENMVFYDAIEGPFEVELPGANQSLQKCLEILPELQRRSVELFYFEEKSYKEIAEMVQAELGMVRSQIQNGKRNLKKCLEGVRSDE